MSNAPENGATRRTMCARASTREYTDEPLTRSDLLVLIQEVVSTLSVHESADQAAG